MKKIIKISDTHYIIVDFDIQFQKGDWVYDFKDKVIRFVKMYLKDEWCKKITHSTELLEGVKNISLSEVEELIYGYIDKSSKNISRLAQVSTEYEAGFNLGYKIGYKDSQEDIKDKLFTIEDIFKAIQLARQDFIEENIDIKHPTEIIQSLLPKQEWEIEIENNKFKLI